jgi:hypothetical protein
VSAENSEQGALSETIEWKGLHRYTDFCRLRIALCYGPDCARRIPLIRFHDVSCQRISQPRLGIEDQILKHLDEMSKMQNDK